MERSQFRDRLTLNSQNEGFLSCSVFQKTRNPEDVMVEVGGTDGTLVSCTKKLIFHLYLGMPNKSACHLTGSSLVCQVRTTGAKFVYRRLQCDRLDTFPRTVPQYASIEPGCLKLLIDVWLFSLFLMQLNQL